MPFTITKNIHGMEEKIKWACASCINGHRSKYCHHWDSWMIRVGPPGRPRSKCAHALQPCPCNTSEKYLMVMIKTNAKGECICKPLRAGQPKEKCTLPVPSHGEDPGSRSNGQQAMIMGHGQHSFNGAPGNSGIGDHGGNRGPPTVGYQSYALNPSQSSGMGYHGSQSQRLHQISTTSPWPQPLSQSQPAHSPVASPGQSTQAFTTTQLSNGYQQATPLQFQPGYNQPSLAPLQYNGHSNSPQAQNYTHHDLPETKAACCLPTPSHTPTQTSESGHGYPQYNPDLEVSHWTQPNDPLTRPQAHPSDSPQANDFTGGTFGNHSMLSNTCSQQQDFHGFTPANMRFPSQPSDRGHASHASPLMQSNPSELFSDLFDFPDDDLHPRPSLAEQHQPDSIIYPELNTPTNCQCGPSCNCLRCTTHPGNAATTEWAQNLRDIMDEDLYNEAASPTSRPHSSWDQQLSSETQMPDVDFLDDYTFLSLPISSTACSQNDNCRCGEDCRCPGCLKHSGHERL